MNIPSLKSLLFTEQTTPRETSPADPAMERVVDAVKDRVASSSEFYRMELRTYKPNVVRTLTSQRLTFEDGAAKSQMSIYITPTQSGFQFEVHHTDGRKLELNARSADDAVDHVVDELFSNLEHQKTRREEIKPIIADIMDYIVRYLVSQGLPQEEFNTENIAEKKLRLIGPLGEDAYTTMSSFRFKNVSMTVLVKKNDQMTKAAWAVDMQVSQQTSDMYGDTTIVYPEIWSAGGSSEYTTSNVPDDTTDLKNKLVLMLRPLASFLKELD